LLSIYLHDKRTFLTELGNPRGNENPFLLAFGVLWFRYHNLKARQIKAANRKWKDMKIFNEARKWVVGTYQVILSLLVDNTEFNSAIIILCLIRKLEKYYLLSYLLFILPIYYAYLYT